MFLFGSYAFPGLPGCLRHFGADVEGSSSPQRCICRSSVWCKRLNHMAELEGFANFFVFFAETACILETLWQIPYLPDHINHRGSATSMLRAAIGDLAPVDFMILLAPLGLWVSRFPLLCDTDWYQSGDSLCCVWLDCYLFWFHPLSISTNYTVYILKLRTWLFQKDPNRFCQIKAGKLYRSMPTQDFFNGSFWCSKHGRAILRCLKMSDVFVSVCDIGCGCCITWTGLRGRC